MASKDGIESAIRRLDFESSMKEQSSQIAELFCTILVENLTTYATVITFTPTGIVDVFQFDTLQLAKDDFYSQLDKRHYRTVHFAAVARNTKAPKGALLLFSVSKELEAQIAIYSVTAAGEDLHVSHVLTKQYETLDDLRKVVAEEVK